ncbi:ECF RNA polymerase sigma factor SigW [bacterium HR23]|nr:ECF RNA polymerase sigma factor SigW [bacterium HR23]
MPHKPPHPPFREVAEKHLDFVYQICLRMLGDPTEAEDAAQETFLSALRAWKTFRGQAQVSTWLYRIAVNACLQRLRRRQREQWLSDAGQDIPTWQGDPQRAVERSELLRRIQEGLARLPPHLRVAVVLRDVQGLSTEEASKIVGVSLPAFKARLHRGRVLLRQFLEPFLHP